MVADLPRSATLILADIVPRWFESHTVLQVGRLPRMAWKPPSFICPSLHRDSLLPAHENPEPDTGPPKHSDNANACCVDPPTMVLSARLVALGPMKLVLDDRSTRIVHPIVSGSLSNYDLRLLRIRESWKVPLCFHNLADDGNYLLQSSVVEARGDGLTGRTNPATSRAQGALECWDSPGPVRALNLVSLSDGKVIRDGVGDSPRLGCPGRSQTPLSMGELPQNPSGQEFLPRSERSARIPPPAEVPPVISMYRVTAESQWFRSGSRKHVCTAGFLIFTSVGRDPCHFFFLVITLHAETFRLIPPPYAVIVFYVLVILVGRKIQSISIIDFRFRQRGSISAGIQRRAAP